MFINQKSLNRREFLATTGLAALAELQPRGFAQTSVARTEGRPEVVTVAGGQLRGELRDGVRVFRGVPFADPPVGPLRFRPPQPARSWMGERDATRFSAAAPQTGATGINQSEDCLYLNVWAPAGAAKGSLPVFCWIHGGGFTGGQSFDPLADGAVFARDGVVCVTLAYRLGVLGFLDVAPLLGAEYAGSANNGLRDLIVALEWVQANIAAFGGDPRRVTIGGESAGAKLADILMGVPSAIGLFSGVISESGGAERVWPRPAALHVAEGFGQAWQTRTGLTVEPLKTEPATRLIEAQQGFVAAWPQHFPLRPEVDGSLVPRLPLLSIGAGMSRAKRLLIGTNREESALFVGAHPAHDPTAADLGNVSLEVFNQVFAVYAEAFPELSVDARRVRAVTAEEYWVPSVRVADAHATSGGQAWMYELLFSRAGGPFAGEAFHTLELPLVWSKPSGAYTTAAQEAALAAQVHAAWVSFLKGNEPAAAGLPIWKLYRPETRATMLLDAVSRTEEHPQRRELELWDGML